MKSVFKPLLLAGLLATAGFSAFSQAPAGPERGGKMGAGMMHEGMQHERMASMDPAKMQALRDKHHAELKAKLQLTPAQEGAWTTFMAAMKPPADMMAKRAEHADLEKLTTPERIDKMKALHTQHMAEMDKHGEAVKAFYATLTPEQQKTFDASTARHHGPEGKRHGPMKHKAPVAPKPAAQ